MLEITKMNLVQIYSYQVSLEKDIRKIKSIVNFIENDTNQISDKISYYIKNIQKFEKLYNRILFYFSVALNNNSTNRILRTKLNEVLSLGKVIKFFQYSVIKKELLENSLFTSNTFNFSQLMHIHLNFIKDTENLNPSKELMLLTVDARTHIKNCDFNNEGQIGKLERLLKNIKTEQLLLLNDEEKIQAPETFLKYLGLNQNIVETLTEIILENKLYIQNIIRNYSNFSQIFTVPSTQSLSQRALKNNIKKIFHSLAPEFLPVLTHFFQHDYIEFQHTEISQGWHIGCPSLKQSRIFLSLQKTIVDIFNLSHELGHAYGSYLQGKHHCYSVNLITIEFGAIFCELYSYFWYIKNYPQLQTEIRKFLTIQLLKYMYVPIEQYFFEKNLFNFIKENKTAFSPKKIMKDTIEKIYGSTAASFPDIDLRHIKTPQYFSTSPFYSLSYLFAFFAAYYSIKQLEHTPKFKNTIKSVLSNLGYLTFPQMYKMLGIDINSPAFYRSIIAKITNELR